MTRRIRATVLVLAALVAVLSGCRGDAMAPAPAAPPGPRLPEGWRWESFREVELAVPGDWRYLPAGWPSCLHRRRDVPYVGRPEGGIPLIGCLADKRRRPAPATTVAAAGSLVWFEDVATPTWHGRTPPPPHEGDRDTLIVGDTRVSIQAPADLRARIRATLRRIASSDGNGCPLRHPVGAPRWRPATATVPDPARVVSISACRYTAGRLWSSDHLAGGAASEEVTALRAAPPGTGPNERPSRCDRTAPWRTPEAGMVLFLRDGRTTTQVAVRWGGCVGRGTDDGTARRKLTRDSVQPLVQGPNVIRGYGTALAPVLRPPG